jgi:hypothetical protein
VARKKSLVAKSDVTRHDPGSSNVVSSPAPVGGLALVGLWSEYGDEAVDEFEAIIAWSRAHDMDREVSPLI